jgi:4-amino-4-deoxy-L-arabinose transferase-like glycosyltransferase
MLTATLALLLLCALADGWYGERPRERLTARLAGSAVLFLTWTIALAWLLSLVSLWRAGAVLAGWALLAAAVWALRGRRFAPWRLPLDALAAIRGSRGIDRALFVFLGLFLVANLFRIHLLPILNIDSHVQHLARAYAWLFADRIIYIRDYYPHMSIVPPNVHLLQATWLKLAGSDAFVEALSLLAYIATVFMARAILMELGLRAPAAASSALLVLAMPIAVVYSVTTQIEAPVLFFQSAVFYFLIRAFREPAPRNLAMLGFSIGLLASSKPQGLILGLAALGVALAVLLAGRLNLGRLAVLCAPAALLPAPAYLFNWLNTGSPYAPNHPRAGFSLAKLVSNVTDVYPEMIFLFPLRVEALAWGRTLTYFDHDESNFGPAFAILFTAGGAVFVARLLRGRVREFSREWLALAAVTAALAAALACLWQEGYVRWDVRILSYQAFGIGLLATALLGRFLARPPMYWLCFAYAAAMIVTVSALDTRSGLPVLKRALALPPELRTFARLSVWENKPGFALQRALDESPGPDGTLLVVKDEYEGEGLGFLAGPGPRRRVHYRILRDSTENELQQALEFIERTLREDTVRWIIVDQDLQRLRESLNLHPERFHPVLPGDAYGALYHVER